MSGRDVCIARCDRPRSELAVVLGILLLLGLVTTPAAAAEKRLRAAWGASMERTGGESLSRATYRNIVRSSVSGSAVRIRLSNAFGTRPITFRRAAVGVRSPAETEDGRVRGAALVAGSHRRLGFGGSELVTIPAGEVVYSDVVALEVRAQQDLAVSLHVEEKVAMTSHNDTFFRSDRVPPTSASSDWGVTQYVTAEGAGDHTDDEDASAFVERGTEVLWLDAVDVLSSAPRAVVTFGDSITEGNGGSEDVGNDRSDRHDRYPDVLARRLAGLPDHEQVSVLNEGISGNRLLGDATSGEGRLDRDVLSQSGITHVVVLLGTNDLTNGATSQEVVGGLRRIADRMHAAGVRVIGGTILPRRPFSTPQIDLYRHQVNDFIRTSGVFDGVADFDEIMRDPGDPERLRQEYDGGDGVHPTPEGYAAMGEGFSLALLGAPAATEIAVPPPATSARPAERVRSPETETIPTPGVPSRAGSSGRRAPGGLTARIVRRRSPRGARLVTSGRLRPPTDLRPAQACAGGVVSVQVKIRRRTISARRVRLRADCSYRSSVVFRSPRRLRRAPRLTVMARFTGNATLSPRRAPLRTVRSVW